MKKVLIIGFLGLACFASIAKAQCAMCTANAEQGVKNGNTQTIGQNKGVLYLLALPFMLAAGAGLVWYKGYRK